MQVEGFQIYLAVLSILMFISAISLLLGRALQKSRCKPAVNGFVITQEDVLESYLAAAVSPGISEIPL